jgi:hypothetical protein
MFLIILTISCLINLSYQAYDRFDHLQVQSFRNKNRKEDKFEPLRFEEIDNYFQIHKHVMSFCFWLFVDNLIINF